MPNELNKILNGVIQGGLALNEGRQQSADYEDAGILYRNATKSLNDLLLKYTQPDPVNNHIDEEGNVKNFSKIEATPTETGVTVANKKISLNDLYEKYQDTESQLMSQYGEPGKLFAHYLGQNFERMLQKPNVTYREIGNSIVEIDEHGRTRVIYSTAPKEVKKKLTASDYQNLKEEDALKLDINEIENGFYYMNPDLQESLKKKYPILQQMHDKDFKEGDFQPKTSSSRLRSAKTSSMPYNLKETERQNSLGEIYKNNENWNNMNDEDKANFVKAKQEMADSMGMSQDELNKLAEDYANARGDRNKKEIVRQTIKQQEEVTQSADDIFSQIIGNDFIHNMYMIDTATEEGLNNLIAQEKAIWKSIGDNWNAIDERIIKNVQQKALNEMNAVRQSKKLPPLTLQ